MTHKIIYLLILCTIVDAIQSVRPGAEWSLNGNTYAGINWIDKTQTKPLPSEIIQAVTDCQTQQVSRKAQKVQARLDVKNVVLTQAQRLQALLILLDYDQ